MTTSLTAAQRGTRPLFLVLVAAVVAAIGLLAPAPASAATSKPKIGQCHQYSIAVYNAASDPTAPVKCSKRHDAITIAVGHLPKSVSYAEAAAMTGRAAKIVDRTCDNALGRRLGATVRQQQLTAYSAAYYVAPEAMFDAGAHWFRCDLILMGSHHLLRLPAHPRGTGKLTTEAKRCLSRIDLGGGAWYSCKDPHRYRAIATFVMHGKNKSYPSEASFDRQAQRHCAPLFGRHGGITFAPSRLWWSHGGRVAICYLKTRH